MSEEIGVAGVVDTIHKLLAATSRALWVSAPMVQTGAVPVENRDSGCHTFIYIAPPRAR